MARVSDYPQNLKSTATADTRDYDLCPSTSRLPSDNLLRYMPCGYIPSFVDDSAAWVKYKTQQEMHANPFPAGQTGGIVHYETRRELMLEYKDRFIFLTRGQIKFDSPRPLDMDWDYYLPLTMLTHDGDDYPFDRFMVNPHSLTSRDKNYGLRLNSRRNMTTDQLICSDSTGFQLRSGQSDWVDPYAIIDFYNRNVDEGMALDIPCSNLPDEVFDACARVQIMNGKVFKKYKRKDLRLGTIIHGVGIGQLKRFKQLIDEADPEWDFCALPSSMSLPALQQIDRLAYLLSNGYQYNQYHQLGMFTLASTVLTARLAHKLHQAGRTVLFTADASTPVFMAKSRAFLSFTAPFESLSRLHVGGTTIGGHANAHKPIACNCAFCKHLGYLDVYSRWEGSPAKYLLNRHNEIQFANWCSMVNDYARDLNDQDFKDFAVSCITGSQRAEVSLGLHYIEVLMQDGWAKAHAKFSHRVNSLAGQVTLTDEFTDHSRDKEHAQALDKSAKRVGKLTKKYIRWYKKGSPSPHKKSARKSSTIPPFADSKFAPPKG